MKLSCNAGISIGDFRAVTANHHRQTGAFVYEREKISQFFTGLGKNITFDTGDLIALITISHPRILSPSWQIGVQIAFPRSAMCGASRQLCVPKTLCALMR
jgi:hypothetical protein